MILRDGPYHARYRQLLHALVDSREESGILDSRILEMYKSLRQLDREASDSSSQNQKNEALDELSTLAADRLVRHPIYFCSITAHNERKAAGAVLPYIEYPGVLSHCLRNHRINGWLLGEIVRLHPHEFAHHQNKKLWGLASNANASSATWILRGLGKLNLRAIKASRTANWGVKKVVDNVLEGRKKAPKPR